MTIPEAISTIEGNSFSSRMNLVSNLRAFVKAAGREPAVRTLFRQIKDPGVRRAILTRVIRLAGLPTDPAYENPWDVALATYAMILTWGDTGAARVAARLIIATPDCWWAQAIAARVLAMSANALRAEEMYYHRAGTGSLTRLSLGAVKSQPYPSEWLWRELGTITGATILPTPPTGKPERYVFRSATRRRARPTQSAAKAPVRERWGALT